MHNFCILFCLKIWADDYIFICTHCWEQMFRSWWSQWVDTTASHASSSWRWCSDTLSMIFIGYDCTHSSCFSFGVRGTQQLPANCFCAVFFSNFIDIYECKTQSCETGGVYLNCFSQDIQVKIGFNGLAVPILMNWQFVWLQGCLLHSFIRSLSC